MPKDPTRNQPNYKIGGSHLNEYEFDVNKGQITKEEEEHFPRSKQESHQSEMPQENTASVENTNVSDETNQKSNA
jgi:hypothetical protein